MIIETGGRGSGKTTRLILHCMELNKKAQANNTVILTRDHDTARQIKRRATELGYPNMPLPVTPSEIFGKPTTWYKRVLVDDMDDMMQQVLGQWELVGYSVSLDLKDFSYGNKAIGDSPVGLDDDLFTVKENKWIPVSERLPDDRKDTYWVCTDGEYQCECRWTNVNPIWTSLTTDWHWCIFDLPQYQEVIAWRPLPEPYKEEVQNDKI